MMNFLDALLRAKSFLFFVKFGKILWGGQKSEARNPWRSKWNRILTGQMDPKSKFGISGKHGTMVLSYLKTLRSIATKPSL